MSVFGMLLDGMVQLWYGYGMAWKGYGMAWEGMVWHGMEWYERKHAHAHFYKQDEECIQFNSTTEHMPTITHIFPPCQKAV